MQFNNTTSFAVETVMGYGPEGIIGLTVIVKGTFTIQPRACASIADTQLPILVGDVYYEEESLDSVRMESDLAPFKPKADVVLVGNAYAPGGKPVTELDASVRVGRLFKSLRIIGDRFWVFPTRLAVVPVMTAPAPFTTMPLVYERAYGGIDQSSGEWCHENLLGTGFCARWSPKALHDVRLPNLEDPDDLILSWKSQPRPVGFGFYDRNSYPRAGFIGTVDEAWAQTRAPRMPADFSFDFYNAAHPDLQVPGYLLGDETVELMNLTPDGSLRFDLSGLRTEVTVTVFSPPLNQLKPKNVKSLLEYQLPDKALSEQPMMVKKPLQMNLDTLCVLPDEGRLYQVWRGVFPLSEPEQLGYLIDTITVSVGAIADRANSNR